MKQLIRRITPAAIGIVMLAAPTAGVAQLANRQHNKSTLSHTQNQEAPTKTDRHNARLKAGVKQQYEATQKRHLAPPTQGGNTPSREVPMQYHPSKRIQDAKEDAAQPEWLSQ
jgi:hypothetical protein